MVKLTDKKIRWIVDQVIRKGERTELVGQIMGVSQRRIQQLVNSYKEHGTYPVLDKRRRPKTYLTNAQKEIIKKAYNEAFLGARLLRHHIRKHYHELVP